MAKNAQMTITELVRRLNNLPPEVHQSAECTVSETEVDVVISIPVSAFAGDDPRSLLSEHGGLYGIKEGE